MRLRFRSQFFPEEPGVHFFERNEEIPKIPAHTVSLRSFCQNWTAEMRKRIDSEFMITRLPDAETGIIVPEAKLIYLLSFVYRLMALSPSVGAPSVSVKRLSQDELSIRIRASVRERGRRMTDLKLLGADGNRSNTLVQLFRSDFYHVYFDREVTTFSVNVSMKCAHYDILSMFEIDRSADTRAVLRALADADRFLSDLVR